MGSKNVPLLFFTALWVAGWTIMFAALRTENQQIKLPQIEVSKKNNNGIFNQSHTCPAGDDHIFLVESKELHGGR
jgi:hypothetical protein